MKRKVSHIKVIRICKGPDDQKLQSFQSLKVGNEFSRKECVWKNVFKEMAIVTKNQVVI